MHPTPHFLIGFTLAASVIATLADAAEIRSEMPMANRDAEPVEVVREVWVDGVLKNQARLLPGQNSDADGDGVPDIDDLCPASSGPVNLCGCKTRDNSCCTDSDNDGVRDCRDNCPGTYPGLPVDSRGCVPASRLPYSLPLDVRFGVASAVLLPGYRSRLEPLAEFLTTHPEVRIQIDGHADSRGSDSYNLGLSKARAEAVAFALVQEGGVDTRQIQTRGFGERQPLVNEETVEAYWANRRVQITFLP